MVGDDKRFIHHHQPHCGEFVCSSWLEESKRISKVFTLFLLLFHPLCAETETDSRFDFLKRVQFYFPTCDKCLPDASLNLRVPNQSNFFTPLPWYFAFLHSTCICVSSLIRHGQRTCESFNEMSIRS